MVRICPICGTMYKEIPATSRKSGADICPTCGIVESLEIAQISQENKEAAVLTVAYRRSSEILRACVHHIIEFEEKDEYIYTVLKNIGFNESEILFLGFNNNIENFREAKEYAAQNLKDYSKEEHLPWGKEEKED